MFKVCSQCERPCREVEADMGVGPYEHFGQRGVHVDLQTLSKCCQAEVLEVDDDEWIKYTPPSMNTKIAPSKPPTKEDISRFLAITNKEIWLLSDPEKFFAFELCKYLVSNHFKLGEESEIDFIVSKAMALYVENPGNWLEVQINEAHELLGDLAKYVMQQRRNRE